MCLWKGGLFPYLGNSRINAAPSVLPCFYFVSENNRPFSVRASQTTRGEKHERTGEDSNKINSQILHNVQ
jgi:hypothetical protein